jgi:hypothetical protein
MASRESRNSLNFSVAVPRGAQRLRELIVYISQRCVDDPWFGAIKLNKILYYADFRAYERFGVPLTGLPYFRLPLGPAPRALLVIRGQLEDEGAIRIEKVSVGEDKEQHRTVALRDPVLSHFAADEIGLVDEVISELWEQNATEVSDASHDIRWKVLNHMDDIPYEFAYLSDEPISDEEIERTRELAAEHGWVESYGR